MPSSRASHPPPRRAGPPAGRPKGAYHQTIHVLKMVRLLAARPWNVADLAQEFGITRRTVFRHLAKIEEAQYPLERQREVGGAYAYRIRRSYDGIPPLSLSPEELLALYFAKRQLDSLHGTPFNEDLERVFNRIKAEQPDRVSNHIERIVTTFYPLTRPVRDYSARREVLVRLREALLYQFTVVLRHQTLAADKPVAHRVQPYVLVAHKNGLYVVGYSERARAIRHFAVERIHAVTVTRERFALPRGFEATHLDRRLFGIFEDQPLPVRIRFSPHAFGVQEKQFHPTQTLTKQRDGSLELRMTAGGLEEIAAWVLSWGPFAKVLGPPALVALVRDRLTAASTQYGLASGSR